MPDQSPAECALRRAAEGTVELCPADRCAFWEPGGAVAPGGCSIERLGIDLSRRDLSVYLLAARLQVAAARESLER